VHLDECVQVLSQYSLQEKKLQECAGLKKAYPIFKLSLSRDPTFSSYFLPHDAIDMCVRKPILDDMFAQIMGANQGQMQDASIIAIHQVTR
jgi:hypothetical protein